MIPDKDLTDDVLDEIIAGAKTSMEQYLALSLKAEREAWRQAGNSPVIPDSSVIGWIRTDYQQDFQVNCTAPQFIMGANDPSDAWGVKYMPVVKAGGQQNAPQNIPEIIPGWIPVSERLPDEGDHVLVSDGVGMEVSWVRGREWKKLRHIYSEDVTHWMPLPAAPQEGK
ncbi:DUF551 domain-containing protein [Klebsiella pneumoniae]|uniref:DUF551 domain-containing protein n=1 Tax=Klebsiella pneumoniae TaxID=573 RepID=UPI0010E9B9EA|nr:DUF551 domain-containing protein [Klebsiella pneumoniae]WKH87364.1 DUF551 domain-containing protein [Klebsiella pneumoniae]VGD14773.1 Eaa1 [Klebsiella pneumoniae]